MRRPVVLAIIALAVLGTAGRLASARRAPARAHAAATKSWSGAITYRQTKFGKTAPGGTVGILGRGRFSAKAGGTARAIAAAVAAAAGVRVSDVLKGGTYAVRFDEHAHDAIDGTLLGRFTKRSLGSVCVSYHASGVTYTGGTPSLRTGSFRSIGGTGPGARVVVKGHFQQGMVTFAGENETEKGTGSISVKPAAHAHGLNATCRGLAAAAKG